MLVVNYELVETRNPISTWNNKYKKMGGAVEGERIEISYNYNVNEIDRKVIEQLIKDYDDSTLIISDKFENDTFIYYLFNTNVVLNEQVVENIAKVSKSGEIIKTTPLAHDTDINYWSADFAGYSKDQFYVSSVDSKEITVISIFDYDFNYKGNVKIKHMAPDVLWHIGVIDNTIFTLDVKNNIISTYDMQGEIINNHDGAVYSSLLKSDNYVKLYEKDDAFYINSIYYDVEEKNTYPNNNFVFEKIDKYDLDGKYKSGIVIGDNIKNNKDTYNMKTDGNGNYYFENFEYTYVVKELGYDVYYSVDKIKILSDSYGIEDGSSIDNIFQNNILFTIILTVSFPVIILNIFIRIHLFLFFS